MDLNQTFVSMFVFLGLFAILIGFLPSQFLVNQPEYSAPTTQERIVVNTFSAMNLTLYKNTWSFTINFDEMKYNQSSLPNGEQIEFHWTVGPYGSQRMFVRHAFPTWVFGWWLDYHYLLVQEPYKTQAEPPEVYGVDGPTFLQKQNLVNLQHNKGGNGSYFEVACSHISTNFLVLPYYANMTIEESWNFGKLNVLSSYEIDWDAMKPSAWMLFAQIMTFQSPSLGIPGVGGIILTYIISSALWASFILLIYSAITRLIPWIRGGLQG